MQAERSVMITSLFFISGEGELLPMNNRNLATLLLSLESAGGRRAGSKTEDSTKKEAD